MITTKFCIYSISQSVLFTVKSTVYMQPLPHIHTHTYNTFKKISKVSKKLGPEKQFRVAEKNITRWLS